MRWLALALLLAARAVIAEPAVILVETRGAPQLPTLSTQVELQISERPIETRVERDADPWTYAERASSMIASGAAAIVVWVAPVDGGYVVFASAPAPGRALIELVRVDATLAPAELERTIALKIAGLLDALRAVPSRVPAIPAVATHAWWIEAGGAIAFERHDRRVDGRSGLALGRAWIRDAWNASPVIGAYWQPSGVVVGANGRASLTEIGTVIAVEGALVMGRVAVFARPRFVLATLFARGDSTDGRRGSATLYSAYGGLEVGARVLLSRAASVGLVLGGDSAFVRHRLAVDEETVIDLGRFRGGVGAFLRVTL
jgi:hypothetical protein